MTEREKALGGQWHNPGADPELRRLLDEAQDLSYQYNRLHPAETDARDALLRRLLGRVGRDCTVLPLLWSITAVIFHLAITSLSTKVA